MSEKSSKFCFCFKSKGEKKDLTYTKRPRTYDEVQIEDGKAEIADKKEGLIVEDIGSAGGSTQLQGKSQGVQ